MSGALQSGPARTLRARSQTWAMTTGERRLFVRTAYIDRAGRRVSYAELMAAAERVVAYFWARRAGAPKGPTAWGRR